MLPSAWQTNRPPGHLMVISSLTGQLISKAVSPDSAEIYCSPIIHNTPKQWDSMDTLWNGGETLGGSFWAVSLNDLLNNDISNSIQIATDSTTGYIAPASAYINENTGYIDFIVQSLEEVSQNLMAMTLVSLGTKILATLNQAPNQ